MNLLHTIFAAQVEEHLTKVGDMLTERGKKEAQEGKEARPVDAFIELAAKAFRLDPTADHDTVQAVADLWRDYYMDGYNTVDNME